MEFKKPQPVQIRFGTLEALHGRAMLSLVGLGVSVPYGFNDDVKVSCDSFVITPVSTDVKSKAAGSSPRRLCYFRRARNGRKPIQRGHSNPGWRSTAWDAWSTAFDPSV